MDVKAFVAGCSGLVLTTEETALFRAEQPWGFILFKRNVDTPDQVRALVDALRASVGREDAPVLVDQEGGRVQRLSAPHWRRYPAARHFSQLAEGNFLRGRELARLGARLMAHDLRNLGITVDCAPVLDVPVPGAHDVIGDRAYHTTAKQVAVLGRAVAEGLIAGGVLPVIKHIPGHGRAGADSHLALPRVDASLDELEASDFLPFRHLADLPIAMTAHVVYSALDADNPATTSPVIIQDIIRKRIGFDGLLISDDLSMKALTGSYAARTRAALDAGCDIVLHCNGLMDEMSEVARAAPTLSGENFHRARAALRRIAHLPEPLEAGDSHALLDEALAVIPA